jgi:DNA invertase Pin-like site-specific DNA recombinase
LIKERQLEGIAMAKKRGVYKGRKRESAQQIRVNKKLHNKKPN